MKKERKTDSRSRIDKCPECRSRNLVHDYDTGETICGDCGLVVKEQTMDRGPEWRAFTEEEKASKSRAGMPTKYSVHDRGLTTDVGGGPGGVGYDAFGRKLPVATRIQMWRLRKWQIRSRIHSSFERNLAQAMPELKRLCEKLSIPKPVKEKAAVIYRKALEKGLIRGRSINGMIAGALLAACRSMKTQRTLQEVADASLKVDKKEIARSYRFIIREFGIQMPIPDPIVCISKIATDARLRISEKSQGLAVKIIQEAKEKKISSGKDPMGLAAAALYIACRQNHEWGKTQKDLAEVAQVTEVTIRNRIKELKQKLGLEVPTWEHHTFKKRASNSLFFMFYAPFYLTKYIIGDII